VLAFPAQFLIVVLPNDEGVTVTFVSESAYFVRSAKN
jgi:hypothetical protein